MTQIHSFKFSPFEENTYVLWDDSNDCVILDPGCYDQRERDQLQGFIENNGLKPVKLLNTHCHLDHVFGNKFVADTWNLHIETHKGELPVLEAAPRAAAMYGVTIEPSPVPTVFLEEGDVVEFGKTKLEVLFTPGHSPASICFYNRAHSWVVSGDVIFLQSIGRTDLPGGNLDTLMQSINDKILTLDDDVILYPGHGPSTTVGAERRANPFIKGYAAGERF